MTEKEEQIWKGGHITGGLESSLYLNIDPGTLSTSTSSTHPESFWTLMTHISLDPNYIYCHCIRAICICTMSASFGVLADIVKKVQVALLFVNVLLILTHFDDRAAPVKKQAIYISWSKKAGTTMGNTFRSTLCFESLSKLHKNTGNRMYNTEVSE